ncbi:MAG: DUF2924 domain-containing protein [Planctomycetota bacterium]
MTTTPMPPLTTDDHALAARIARVGQMPPRELREVHRLTFGRETTSGNRAWLVRAISNRLREIEESHQRPRALTMAQAVAKDLGCEGGFFRYLQALPPVVPLPRPPEEAFEPPAASSARDPRIPPPGTVLVRHFGDRDYRMTVTADGFMRGRHRYGSLSAVAKAITGMHWNGFLFFGIE